MIGTHGRELMQAARRIATSMVGINELQLAREAAQQVFEAHGGNPHGDPRLGPCDRCGTMEPCAAQSLAFSNLLLCNVFEMSVEQLTDRVLEEIGRRVRNDEI